MGRFVLNRFGIRSKEEGDFLSFDDSYKLQELYPFSGIIDLHINRISYTKYGDIAMSDLSDLINKTDNPGLAFIASVSGDAHTKEEVFDEKKMLENKFQELADSGEDNLFFRENYSFEAFDNTLGREYFKRRKYLFEEIKKVHRLYEFKKKWQAEKKTKSLEQTEKITLNKSVASEKLAEIYLKQGMKDKAIEMYHQLILDNPKKSDYFAQILKKIN